MTCTYRRKRIPEVPADAARALDDEYYAIEQVADCLQAQANALQAALDALTATIGGLPYLTEVKEDLSPDLGGPLRTWGFPIVLSSDIDAQQGILEALDGGGIGIATTDIDGFWDPADAAIGLNLGNVRVAGTTTTVNNLASDGLREVWADEEGTLFTVAPPLPGWTVTDTDTGGHVIGLTWTPITGLVVNTVADIAAGDRFDATGRIRVINTSNESGLIRFAFGLNGNPPLVVGETVNVAANFTGRVPIAGWSLAENDIPAGTPVMVWVIESAGNVPQFDPAISGLSTEPHTFTISVEAGGGASGATNLAVANITTTALTITSDTGADAVVPAATNTTAGLATAAQVALIEGAVQDGDARLHNPYRIFNGSAVQVGVIDIAPGNGVAIAATDAAGIWQVGYGAIDVTPTGTQIAGTTVRVDSLATGAAKAVLVDADGDLYTGVVDTPTDLAVALKTTDGFTITSSTGNSALLPAATPSLAGLMTGAQATALASTVPNTRAINTSEGLQGGGNLSLDRTIKPVYGTTLNTVCMGNDTRLSASLRYMGDWVPGAYALNDTVRTYRWLARANKATSQDPRPVSNGRKNIITTEPAWVSYTTAWSMFGIQVASVAAKQILVGVRVKIPTAGIINLSIGVNNASVWVYRDYYLEANRWVDLYFTPVVINAGDKLDLMVDSTTRYQLASYFPVADNVQGFIRTGYPVLPGELIRMAFAVNGIYDDISSWPTDWDMLSGY